MAGDTDVVRPEHVADLYRLLRNARLAIIPGTDHMALMTRTHLIGPIVNEFLDKAMPVS